MRITKVYTRTGDAGKTRLAGGQQVWKDSLRVEAYGTVDELNASVGVVRAMNADIRSIQEQGMRGKRVSRVDSRSGRIVCGWRPMELLMN